MINQTFGTKLEGATYHLRTGIYMIAIQNNQLAVVRTSNGYFLLGGGIENDETHTECLKRECLEEIGSQIQIGTYLGCAQEYRTHPEVGYRHAIQFYYDGEILKKIQEPIELDHSLEWLSLDQIDCLKVQSQRWAVTQYIQKTISEKQKETTLK